MERERERGAMVTEESITAEAVADRNNYYSTLCVIERERERKSGTAHTLLFFTRGEKPSQVRSFSHRRRRSLRRIPSRERERERDP